MLNSGIVRKAHEMARKIKEQYPEVDYRFQYGLYLSYLLKEGENKMVELKGSEKQVKWAEDVRKEIAVVIDEFEKAKQYLDCKETTKEKISNKLQKVKETLENETSAKYFIDTFANLTYIQKKLEKVKDKYETLDKTNENTDKFNRAIKMIKIEKVESFYNIVFDTELKLSGRLLNAVKEMYDM